MPDDAPASSTRPGAHRRAFVYRHVVSLQETNLVGNVYFAHLAAWQGRCREMFLRTHAPDSLSDLQAGLKLVTTRLRIDYGLELFAFDEVEILMRLVSVNGHKVRMDFEYQVERDGLTLPAAQGEQEVAVFVDGRPSPPPPALLAALRSYMEA